MVRGSTAYIQPAASITVLKVDTEGHDADVMVGAMGLIKEQRVGTVFIEILENGRGWGRHEDGGFLREILAAGCERLALPAMLSRVHTDTRAELNGTAH